jgi:hypothetical protein
MGERVVKVGLTYDLLTLIIHTLLNFFTFAKVYESFNHSQALDDISPEVLEPLTNVALSQAL